MRRLRPAGLALLLAATAIAPSRAGDVPSPEAHLGYRPGADYHLARWGTVVDYFRKVDAASDRVLVRELGRTAEDRPYIVAVVADPKTLDSLDRYRELQHQVADPRRTGRGAGADPLRESKVVVLITCSIHSTETASTLMAMELLHELATRDDAATREVLDRVILLLVPSANPDGVEKVAAWYERSKGHPWEGSGLPELYHKYAGHDTNRDWFMLNLPETRHLTRLLYKEWFPTLTYDVHQMGSKGARLFVPPFYDPINPNLDPRIHQSIALIGAHMAADLAGAGKRGVLTHAMYDNWWNGGNRTTPQRHNMVGVLTEAASVKLATPIFLNKEDLRGGARGFADHKPAVNFVDPWPGGWWRLRDIVEYEEICARSLLTLAARYKDDFQRNYQSLARDAIAAGKSGPPFAWVVPADQRDPGTAARLVRTLHETGVEVRRARAPFRADGISYPAGSWVLPASQPYRAHLKDMMERQRYPARFTADGAAEPPYDVAGWTLPLLMGVRAVEVAAPFEADAEAVEQVEAPRGRIDGNGSDRAEAYLIRNEANDDFRVLNALLAAGIEVRAAAEPFQAEGVADDKKTFPAGTLIVKADSKARRILDEVLPKTTTRATAVEGEFRRGTIRLRAPRIGLYQPWMPSMDEGWTRLVLEQFDFPYTTLHNAEVRAGDLGRRFDVVLIPSIDAKTLREGYQPDETEPAYVGGLGGEGLDALRDFVHGGGTLVCLGDSCTYAIDGLGLPATNVVKDLKTSTFYGPGSIVRLDYSSRHFEGLPDEVMALKVLTFGMPWAGSAYFDRSLAFDLKQGQGIVAARYAATGVLESGWLLGPEKIQGKAAVVEVPRGEGRVILFGFPPQFRAQTHGTFRLLFNALLRSGTGRVADAP
jgi:hypothetical protein